MIVTRRRPRARLRRGGGPTRTLPQLTSPPAHGHCMILCAGGVRAAAWRRRANTGLPAGGTASYVDRRMTAQDYASSWTDWVDGRQVSPPLAAPAIVRGAIELCDEPARSVLCHHYVLVSSIHGDWTDFDAWTDRAALAVETLPEEARETMIAALRVAIMRWHLATADEATGTTFATGHLADPDAWLRHAAHTAMGLWALRARDPGAAEAHLSAAQAAVESGRHDGLVYGGPMSVLFARLRSVCPSSSAVDDYRALLATWRRSTSFADDHAEQEPEWKLV